MGLITAHRKQFLRFLIAGTFSTGIQYLALALALGALGKERYVAAAALAYCVHSIARFMLHRFWTFGSHKTRTNLIEVATYAATNVATGFEYTLLMFLLVSRAGLPIFGSQVLLSVVLSIQSYVVLHYVFKKPVPQ